MICCTPPLRLFKPGGGVFVVTVAGAVSWTREGRVLLRHPRAAGYSKTVDAGTQGLRHSEATSVAVESPTEGVKQYVVVTMVERTGGFFGRLHRL